jgi:hypothetical protein
MAAHGPRVAAHATVSALALASFAFVLAKSSAFLFSDSFFSASY